MPIFDYGYGTGGYGGSSQDGYGERSSAMGYGMDRAGGSGMGLSSSDRYAGMAAAMGLGGGSGYDGRSDIGYLSGPSPYSREMRARSRSPLSAPAPPEVKCFKCTKLGHMAKDCTAELLCYSCNGTGHISRDCKDSTNGPKCYSCQNIGHMAKDCPSLIAQGMVASGIIGPQGVNTSAALNGFSMGGFGGRGGSGSRGGGAYRGMGMMRGGGFMPRAPASIARSGVNCHQCGGYGHMARDCPTEKKCYKCQGLGHIAKLCPNMDAGGGRPTHCFKCNLEGHFARDCKTDAASLPTTTAAAEGEA